MTLKNGALNRVFAKVAPKNIIFSKTYTLFDRLAFVICVDSLGYKEILHHLMVLLVKDEEYKVNHVVMGWARVQDKIKLYMQNWQKDKEQKIKHKLSRKQLLMLKHLDDNQAKQKGDIYCWGAGVAMLPDSFEDSNGNVSLLHQCKNNISLEGRLQKAKEWQKETECGHCHEKTHLCVTSQKCWFNKYNLAKAAAEEKAAAEAAAKAAGNATPTWLQIAEEDFQNDVSWIMYHN